MGSTLSRPLQSLESGLLSAASALDSILARAERGVTSLFSRALGPLFGFDTSRRIARACDDDGFCYVPATHAARAKEQRLARGYTRSRIARRAKRAEAAARGQVGEALDRVASRANEEKERLVRVTSRANDEKDRLIKIVEADRVKVVAAVEGVLHDNEKKLHAAEAKLRAAIDVEKQKVGKARQSLDAQRTAVTEAVLNVKGALHLTPAEPPSPDASPLKAVDPTALINSVWNYGASFWQVSPSPSSTQLPPAQAELVAKSLGEPARAPAPRSERERETAAERAKGQLWVMGNVAPAKAAVAPPPPPPPHVESVATPSPRGRQRTKGLDSVREVVSMYGSPPRPAAATVPAETAEEVKLLHGHGRRKNGSEHDAITYQVVATSAAAAAEATTPSPKLKLRKSSKPTAAKEEPVARASPALVAPTPRRAAQAHALHAEPTLVAPTAQRAAPPARINTALAHSPPTRVSSPPLSRSAGAQQRTSFEAQRTPGGGGGRASPAPSFDAVSIAASWGRSATPPVVAELADKACQSRKRERKAWKDEVNRMALERCQANSARARASTPSSPVVASSRPASPGLGLVRKLSNGPALVRVKSARAANNKETPAVQTQRLNATLGAARARRVSAPLAARAV